jgi:hypothetical protein
MVENVTPPVQIKFPPKPIFEPIERDPETTKFPAVLKLLIYIAKDFLPIYRNVRYYIIYNNR